MWKALKVPQSLLLVWVLLGWLAYYLPPDAFWWVALLAVFLPYVTLALVPGIVLFAVLHRRLWMWISLAGLLLGGSRVFFMPSFARATAQGDVLRMMTYNFQPQSGSVPVGKDGLARLVQGQRPAIIAFQDVELVRVKHRILGPTGVTELLETTAYRPLWPEQNPERYDQPVLALPEVDVQQVSQYVFAYGENDVSPAVVTRVRFTWDGREAALYNVHLRSFGSRKPWWEGRSCWLSPRCWLGYLRMYREAYRKRAFEVRQIRRLLDEEALPVILVGDFNSSPYNWSYAQLRGRRVDVYAAAGSWPGFTYHSKQPFVRIDFILADPAFEALEARVIRVRYSDHLPVVGAIRWAEP